MDLAQVTPFRPVVSFSFLKFGGIFHKKKKKTKKNQQRRFYLFLERGREGEREREKHQRVVASHMPPTGDLAGNLGMCPKLGI